MCNLHLTRTKFRNSHKTQDARNWKQESPEMSTIIQAATSTYASRIKTGNTPLIIPSSSVLVRNRALVTGTPLATTATPVPASSARPQRLRSSSVRMNGEEEDEDEEDEEDEEDLDIESDEETVKKDKEEEEWEESGGFVAGPPPDVLIQRRNAPVTKHVYRYVTVSDGVLM